MTSVDGMTEQDWWEFEAALATPKPRPTAAERRWAEDERRRAGDPRHREEEPIDSDMVAFLSDTREALGTQAVDPAPTPSREPEPGPRPCSVRTADEIVAEQAAKDAGPLPERPPAPDFRPRSRPPLKCGIGDPHGQHQPTVRAEVVELRKEVSELARMIREIHSRIVTGGR
jgi:hypothetical protein